MNNEKIEHFLARLYTDEELLKSFLENPNKTLLNESLSEEEKAALLEIDLDGLQMAANSYKLKRKRNKHPKNANNFLHFISMLKEKLKRK